MTSDIKLPHHLAEAVCTMEAVCFSEGIGPDVDISKELMVWIASTYPDLQNKYGWLPWEVYNNKTGCPCVDGDEDER